MEFTHSLFVTFVVLTVDQFVGLNDDQLERQKQNGHICSRNCTFPLILLTNQSHHCKDDEV